MHVWYISVWVDGGVPLWRFWTTSFNPACFRHYLIDERVTQDRSSFASIPIRISHPQQLCHILIALIRSRMKASHGSSSQPWERQKSECGPRWCLGLLLHCRVYMQTLQSSLVQLSVGALLHGLECSASSLLSLEFCTILISQDLICPFHLIVPNVLLGQEVTPCILPVGMLNCWKTAEVALHSTWQKRNVPMAIVSKVYLSNGGLWQQTDSICSFQW